MVFWNSLAFLMIQQILAIWSLVPLPFLKPAWTSGISWFMYYWSLAWRILSITLLVCAAKSLQSYPTLCDPIDSSPSGSPIPGILQARTLEWVAISFSNAWKKSESEVAQSCPTLSDPMDCSLPGTSIHGIFQARVLEWGAIAVSLTSVWDECNYAVVWAFFGIASLWDWMKTDLFQSCGHCWLFQICWHIE